MTREPPPSFSLSRRWLFSLNVFLSLLAMLALLLMVNYLAARHFKRFSFTGTASFDLSPLTKRVLESVTNQVKVVIFFDRSEPLYESVYDLLKEYRFFNSWVTVETVDYERSPVEANLIKAKYKLTQLTDKDMVIFESGGRTKFVYRSELSELDVQPLLTGQSSEIRRTHFKGELMFTSAIFSLISPKPLKAYFLQSHNEHSPDSDDADSGYSKFANVLRQSNLDWARLALAGANEIPADCSLLIIAAPTLELLPEELAKIERYLKGGGRALVLLNYFGVHKSAGLARILAEWGANLGDNVVRDRPNSSNQEDILVTRFGLHPIVKPLMRSGVHVILPRSVRKRTDFSSIAGGPEVTELLYTGPKGTIITDIRNGVPYENPRDVVTNVSLAVALEKGKIKGVTAERGTTRMVVVGDSLFLSNRMIDSAGNSDFASLAVNWLLDRSELLGNLPPRPIREYQTTLTASQMAGARILFLVAMPGTVLLIGFLVWMRRRK